MRMVLNSAADVPRHDGKRQNSDKGTHSHNNVIHRAHGYSSSNLVRSLWIRLWTVPMTNTNITITSTPVTAKTDRQKSRGPSHSPTVPLPTASKNTQATLNTSVRYFRRSIKASFCGTDFSLFQANSSSNAFASFKSAVSNPSVNQP
jgi:hypothetical protein